MVFYEVYNRVYSPIRPHFYVWRQNSNSTLQAACISFDYMWGYCAIWALIWSATIVVNADYNGVMISNDTEHTICLRTYIVCSMTYLQTYVLCSTTCYDWWGTKKSFLMGQASSQTRVMLRRVRGNWFQTPIILCFLAAKFIAQPHYVLPTSI